MKLLNYAYYRISDSYINKWKDSAGYVHGFGLMTFLEIIHIILILFIIELFSAKFSSYFQPLAALSIGVIFIANIFIFNKSKYLLLSEKYKNEDKTKRKARGWVMFYYTLLIICATISLGFYLNIR